MATVDLDLEPNPGVAATRQSGAALAPVLALSVTLAVGAFLLLMPALLLVVHPGRTPFANPSIIGQNQTAKSALYLATFAVLLPLALAAARRLADRVAGTAVASWLVTTLALALIVARLLPGGLVALLGVMVVWWLLAAAVLARAVWVPAPMASPVLAGAAVLGAILCITPLAHLNGVGVAVGLALALAMVAVYERVRLPRPARAGGLAVDLLAVVLLLLAIPDLVIFKTSAALPNIYFPPGVIQLQQDWLLGPTNQLLGGGTLLVNVPSSQYGVGLIYFLAGWFHLVPIGYGMFGLLDGILTALFYVAGYAVMRIAGVGRSLAWATLGFAVLVFLYNLPYSVGALPEQGPLRFGLPMVVILSFAAAGRWPRWRSAGRGLALAALALASVWALEAFAYTAFTFLAVVAVESALRPPGARRRWLVKQIALVIGACVAAHLVLALATLAASGHLPDWSQYLAYVRGLLLGGREGSTTYGFADWSPGLGMGAVCLASAAAIVLILLRRRELLAVHATRLLAVTGLTAYAIASFSYTDNRSSTYLLLYVALPVLMALVLWLDWFLGLRSGASELVRRGALGLVLITGALMLGAAWPAIGPHFSRSALAHAYPGGGLRAAVRRLAHPPPIDPRAPEVERLLTRYDPGRRPLILFAGSPDLALEATMRSGRRSPLFLGDPSEEVWIPSVWMPRIGRQLAGRSTGRRILLDTRALRVMAQLRGRPANYAMAHQVIGLNGEIAWILHQLDLRFRLHPIYRDRDGFIVAQLAPRSTS